MKTRNKARSGLAQCCIIAIAAMAFTVAHAQPPQRVIVKYRANLSAEALQSATPALSASANRFGVALSAVRRSAANGAQVLRLDKSLAAAELSQLISDLAANPNVEYVEEDRLLQPLFTPNDPFYNEQWHYYENTAGIRLPAAWDLSTGSGVTVAVIDTGYRPHVDLAANIVGGYDFISDTFVSRDGNLRDSDARDPGDWNNAGDCGPNVPAQISSWHGTHVSGTIAALSNNSRGVAGVAFNSRVLPVRVLGRCGGFTSDIADALVWASGGNIAGVPANPNPAQVANLSLGGGGPCGTTMQSAINSARSRGTVVVVAAGNASANASSTSPANCSGVVTVASVNRNGGRSYFSNFGSVVDLAAPGGDVRFSFANGILSTLNFGNTTPGNDAYAYYQGTSMAAPHVAGVAALMLSVNGSLNPNEVEQILRNTTRNFPASCSQCGTGILNAASAVAAADGS